MTGSDWLDEISSDGTYDWERYGDDHLQTRLRSDLPCRITVGRTADQPVLYMSIGTNGTARYWQWASLDRETGRPLPRSEAIRCLRQVMGFALVTSKSRFEPKLVDWSTEVA